MAFLKNNRLTACISALARPKWILLLLVLFNSYISFVELKVLSRKPELFRLFDAPEYISIAENLTSGRGYVISAGTFVSPKETSYRTPGYPFLLVLMRWLYGEGNYIAATILLQNLILAFFPLLFYGLTMGIFKSRDCALWAAALSVLFTPFRMLAELIQPEFLALFFLLSSVFFLLRYLEKRQAALLLLSSLSLASSIMLKQNLVSLLLIILFPLPLWLKKRELALGLLFPLLFISPWVYRNWRVHGEFPVFATNGGLNFYLANLADLPMDLQGIAKYQYRMTDLVRNGLSETEADRELYRQGFSHLQKNGLHWGLKRLIEKAGVIFRDHSRHVRNEIFYFFLPLAFLFKRKIAVVSLVAMQIVFSLARGGPFAFSPYDLYSFFSVDILPLNVIGLLAMIMLLLKKIRLFGLLATMFILLLAPMLIAIPLDRMTMMADSCLLIAFAAVPLAFPGFSGGKRWPLNPHSQISGQPRE